MTVTAPPPPASAPASTVRRSPVRGILIGVGLAVVFVIVATIVYAVTRTEEREPDYLSPSSGSPAGARGVVEVLRDQGVEVIEASTLDEVRAAVDDPAETTIAFYDTYLVLGPDQRDALLDLGASVVVFDPWDDELAQFAPGVVLSDTALAEDLTADCDVPAIVRAEELDTFPYVYDVAEAENDVTGCLAADEADAYALVVTRTGASDVTLVGAGGAVTNGEVLDAGNAAFALGILGERETLVWYRPSLAELDSGDIPTAANRTAPWLTPLIVLALAVGLAAAIWRGRRLGPLVMEKLPVVVRSNETMEGRARLYERAGSRSHALDTLRIGAVGRLATRVGLPKRASVDEVITSVAALTGRDRAAVADLLVGREPASDAALVRLSDELLLLEKDVARVTRGR